MIQVQVFFLFKNVDNFIYNFIFSYYKKNIKIEIN